MRTPASGPVSPVITYTVAKNTVIADKATVDRSSTVPGIKNGQGFWWAYGKGSAVYTGFIVTVFSPADDTIVVSVFNATGASQTLTGDVIVDVRPDLVG